MIRRIILDKLITIISILSALIGIIFLFWILKDVLVLGAKSINWSFFFEDPKPPGIEGGGMRNAIVGSFIISFLAILIGFPIALLSATYINEYNHRIAITIRFISDTMLSAPSIIIGAYVYAIFVKPFKTFSAISGSIALAVILTPIALKTIDELLKLVPNVIKEAAYALGAPKWKVITYIIWGYIRTGILTAFLMTFARIFGETAPLLFTSFNNAFLSLDITRPMATLTVNIFNFAMSPYETWHKLAWASSFFIVLFVLIVNIISRILQGKQSSN